MKKLFLFLALTSLLYSNVDAVIFSYDRPLQLYALLESLDSNATGIATKTVIYRTSSKKFKNGYKIVKRAFPDVQFKAQGEYPSLDFKPLVLASIFSSPGKYVFFAVDDMIVTRPIDFTQATHHLEETGAYCFAPRLGLNIDFCYMLDTPVETPNGKQMGSDFFVWNMGEGKGDWGYPNSVDATLYRKESIQDFFYSCPYSSPNKLEAGWAAHANSNQSGICYLHSCTINIPMNVVAKFNNRQMNYKTAEELLEIFLSGNKIDVSSLQYIENHSPHFEIEPLYKPLTMVK